MQKNILRAVKHTYLFAVSASILISASIIHGNKLGKTAHEFVLFQSICTSTNHLEEKALKRSPVTDNDKCVIFIYVLTGVL